MSEAFSSFMVAFTAVFVVVEPLGAAPMFAAMTRTQTAMERRRTALRASLIGAGILAFFALGGASVLRLLQIDLSAFRVAGGLLLLLTAFDMLRAREPTCRCSSAEVEAGKEKDDIAVVPLAMPMLAGPGSIATVMVLVAQQPGAAGLSLVLAAVAATFAATFLVLRSVLAVERVLNRSVMAVVQRVLGLLLAAIAVQFMASGGLALVRVAGV